MTKIDEEPTLLRNGWLTFSRICTFVVNQSLFIRINICGVNRHLRQARNRYWQFSIEYRDRQKFQNQSQKFELKICKITNFW